MRSKKEIYIDLLYSTALETRMISGTADMKWPWHLARGRKRLDHSNILADFIHNVPKRLAYDHLDNEDYWFIEHFPGRLLDIDSSVLRNQLLELYSELYTIMPEADRPEVRWLVKLFPESIKPNKLE